MKDLIYVEMEEFGVLHIYNVCALKDIIGMDTAVWLIKNAQEVNILISVFKNAFAYQVFNGMARPVSNVIMEKFGILQLYHVHALSEQVNQKVDVNLNKNVAEESNGIKIHGHANALGFQPGMEIIAS